MKKLGMLLMFVSLCCFTVGCGGDTATDTSTEPAATTPDDAGTGTDSAPAEGDSGSTTAAEPSTDG